MARSGDQLPRLSGREALILELLGRAKSMYGLELVAASGGELKRGTVYVTLGRMEEKGYITSRVEETAPAIGGLPRRLYTATPHGRAVFSAVAAMKRRLMPRLAR
jgi:DNA-binding PadR family transcriptional regulator